MMKPDMSPVVPAPLPSTDVQDISANPGFAAAPLSEKAKVAKTASIRLVESLVSLESLIAMSPRSSKKEAEKG
jgi:hypothetical protein